MFFLPQSAQLACGECVRSFPADQVRLPLGRGVLAAMRHILYSEAEKLFSFSLPGPAFARLEEPVRRAVALLSENGATQELWALAGPEGRGAIWVCDLPTGTWRRLPGGELPCSEIVLAR